MVRSVVDVKNKPCETVVGRYRRPLLKVGPFFKYIKTAILCRKLPFFYLKDHVRISKMANLPNEVQRYSIGYMETMHHVNCQKACGRPGFQFYLKMHSVRCVPLLCQKWSSAEVNPPPPRRETFTGPGVKSRVMCNVVQFCLLKCVMTAGEKNLIQL